MALRGLVGMVCLVVGAILSARTCQASCGDYVVLKGSPAKMHEAEGSLSIPTPIKVPCNSPACRGEVPYLPVPQAPPSESPTEKPLALFDPSLSLEGGSPNGDWLSTREHVCSGFRAPLERPPAF